jgi:hypothetical protein
MGCASSSNADVEINPSIKCLGVLVGSRGDEIGIGDAVSIRNLRTHIHSEGRLNGSVYQEYPADSGIGLTGLDA